MKQFVSRRSFLKAACITAATMPLLTGCTPKEKSEKAILEDLQVKDSMYQEYGLKIDSSEITKRQTNSDSKTDYVWITVTSSNSDFIYESDYELEYRLYNDGWLLDSYLSDRKNYTPLYYPSEEDVLSDIQLQHDNSKYNGSIYKIIDSQLENPDKIIYQLERTTSDGYLNMYFTDQMKYSYSPDNGWLPSVYESLSKYDLDVVGEWIYTDNSRNFYFNILSFDTNDETIELEYNIDGYIYMKYTGTYWFSSEYPSTFTSATESSITKRMYAKDSRSSPNGEKIIDSWYVKRVFDMDDMFYSPDLYLSEEGICIWDSEGQYLLTKM